MLEPPSGRILQKRADPLGIGTKKVVSARLTTFSRNDPVKHRQANLRITTEALVPPKPNELDTATRISAFRA